MTTKIPIYHKNSLYVTKLSGNHKNSLYVIGDHRKAGWPHEQSVYNLQKLDDNHKNSWHETDKIEWWPHERFTTRTNFIGDKLQVLAIFHIYYIVILIKNFLSKL